MGFNVGDKVFIERKITSLRGLTVWVPEMDEYLNNGEVYEIAEVYTLACRPRGVPFLFPNGCFELAAPLFHTGAEV